MNNLHNMLHDSTTFGTLGGTVLTLITLPPSANVSMTIILATIGALTSFGVSLLLKALWKYITVKFKKK